MRLINSIDSIFKKIGSVYNAIGAVVLLLISIIAGRGLISMGDMYETDSMEKIGVYTMTATSTDITEWNSPEWDDDGAVINNKEYTYYVIYTCDETENVYREEVSKDIYDSFNNGNYENTVEKSYWEATDGNQIKFAEPNATEKDVVDDMQETASLSRKIGYAVIALGIIISLLILIRTIRKSRRRIRRNGII